LFVVYRTLQGCDESNPHITTLSVCYPKIRVNTVAMIPSDTPSERPKNHSIPCLSKLNLRSTSRSLIKQSLEYSSCSVCKASRLIRSTEG
jgi:hypothetical protein